MATLSSSFETATLPQMCFSALSRHKKADTINHKQDGAWLNISSETFAERVRSVALGLMNLGVRRGDRIALLSENRAEWSIADLAILSLGAVNVPIYTTQAPDQIRFILEDSGARMLFVSGRKVFRHARPGVEVVEQLERIIFFDEEAGENISRALTLAEIEQDGAQHPDPNLLDEAIENTKADDLATIIYTSGTTGDPKGVMLSHRNFVSNVLAISSELPILNNDVALSVLPLSHIFERTVFYVFCWNGVSVYYVASFDQVGEHLQEIRPTIMTAVPRLFEKVYHRIVKKGTSAEGSKRKIFEWAMRVGLRFAELKDKRQSISPVLRLQHALANRLVFSKWREGIGGRLRFFVSGGAPLSPALSYAFLAAGIEILQGYGMTETCIVAANRPESNRVGSVGLPFPGIELKTAEDGEILVRGSNVMQGYYNHEAETQAVFTEDGWFQTGDVGRIDSEGRLYITDRKKELFKLSNGKYIAPQLIESLIKQSAMVGQVVVVGAGRKQPAALIVPEWDALAQALKEAGEEPPKNREELSLNKTAVRIVQKEIAKLTAELADYERVRRVALLADEFSIDGGELTPTLKVRRRVIDEKYGSAIDGLYEG
jgi:long-chain acyl-CoA synthetase